MPDLSFLPEKLIPWFEQNGRSLPWRIEPSPYHVWVSEIMLQQTRIEAAISTDERFLAALPPKSARKTCSSSGKASAIIPAPATCKKPPA